MIISSVEPKAMAKPFRTLKGLHEHDRTRVEFLDREQFKSLVEDFFNHPGKLVMGWETANQACERFSNALQSTAMEDPNKNMVVVSHGTLITLFVERAAGLEAFPFWEKLDLPSFVFFPCQVINL